MWTNKSKLLGATIVFVAAFGGLSYSQYLTNVRVNSLQQPAPITVTKTVVVTPTIAPTATPSAVRIYTPAKANFVTKGVAK